MNHFVGASKNKLSASQIREIITQLAINPSYYFLRWHHEVRGICEQLPSETDFPMIEGQMFNQNCELRWKQKSKDSYEVLLLSVAGGHPDFKELDGDWQAEEKRDAYLYPPTETRFPKGFTPTNLDVAQRYFIDQKTATVHFVALTVGRKK
jgi:hypothetical protein